MRGGILHTLTRHAFGSYWLLFLLLFLQFPLQNSLPGQVDTWFFLTAFETISNELGAWLSGNSIGHALYPEAAVFPFGNYSPACALAYLPFRALGISPLWAYYLFYTLLFASGAYGMFLLARQLSGSRPLALLAGLIFATSNFAFASMDNPDTLGFFPALLAITFFLRFLKEKKGKFFLFTVLAGSLEVYFSSYIFLFGCLILGLIGLAHLRAILSESELRKSFLLYFPLFVVILIPYARIYLFGDAKASAWNPGEGLESIVPVSLHPADWLRHLPENLLWPTFRGEVGSHNWLAGTRSAGIGIALWVLGIFGWWKWKAMRRPLALIWLAGLFLALGPYLSLGEWRIPSLLYPLYKFAHINDFFRISIRAWFIGIGVFALTSAYALHWLHQNRPTLKWLPALLLALLLLENIPFPFRASGNGKYLELPATQAEALTGKSEAITLDLPSGFYAGYHPDFPALCQHAENFFEHQVIREYVYMYWQTRHKQHSLNGFTGFIPPSRLENQRDIVHIAEGKHLENLIRRNSLNFIVFHKDMELDCEDLGELEAIQANPHCELLKEDEKTVIFTVKAGTENPNL